MIPQNFNYHAPATLKEALGLIANGAKPLAGGMSLIPLMKLRLAAPEEVVDLRRIEGLDNITEQDGLVRIGAMATHYAVESSALVRARCPLLAETAGWIGDVQVRNAGTIGGSVAHSDPAADYPAALMALEAQVLIAGAKGVRTVPYGDFVVDTFMTALEPDELIQEILVPVEPAGNGCAYAKMLQPASGFAIVGVAVRIGRSAGKVTFARVGVTGLGPKAYRATGVEDRLLGTSGLPEEIRQAVADIAEGVEANTDIHASSDYRSAMVRVYAARAVARALERAA
jgi:aerobic carbon-monoxide dehydrogenase medium subunit